MSKSLITWALLTALGGWSPASGAHSLQDTSPIPGSKLAGEDRLEGELQHVDPSLEGWNSEVLSSMAQDQLTELGHLMHGDAPVSASDLPKFVSESVQCTEFRPEALQTLSNSSVLRVARGDIATEMKSGKTALAESLSGLRAIAGKEGEEHVKVKVVRIAERGGGQTTTQGLFRLWVEGPSGISQCDAIWTCEWQRRGEVLELSSVAAMAYTESSSTGPLFADCSESLLGANDAWTQQLLRSTDDWCGRIERGASMDQYGHNGLSIGDYDGDGLEDLYLLQAGGLPNRLFVQNADGTATERAAEFGLDWVDDSKAALLCDLDGDRQKEILVSTLSGIVLAKRNARGQYEIATVLDLPGAYSLAAADADGDGRIDLFACNYATSETRSGLPAPYHDANNGPPNRFFRNLGGLKFENATAAVGLDQNNQRFSFAASWTDFDEDGDPDLYVANDFGRNNLYRNDGGRFTDIAGEAGVEDISAGMGVSWGDYDGDGHMDVYVSNMFSSAGQRIAYQRRFKASADNETREGFQRHARGNSLFRNNGDGTFSDVTVAANVWMGRWSWGAGFVDFDNDGVEDIFVPNGFVTNENSKDL